MATSSAPSTILGSVVVRRSGHGRFSRPDIVVIFADSHRLSVSVSIAMMVAILGPIMTSASTARSVSPWGMLARLRMTRIRKPRKAALIVSASLPNVRNALIVVMLANTATHARIRPSGYQSSAGARLASCGSFETGRASRVRCPSHHAGSAMVSANAAM